MIRIVLIVVLLLAPLTVRAGEAWPALRFSRLQSAVPATEPTLTLGAAMAVGDLAGRVASNGQLGLGYAGPLAGDLGWHVGVFGAEANRDRRRSAVFGHARLGLGAQTGDWTWSLGGYFWAGDDVSTWARSASPYGALAWQHPRLHVGASFLWARIDDLSLASLPSRWRERAPTAYQPTMFLGWDAGPTQMMVAYRGAFDSERLVRDAMSAEAGVPLDFGIGRGLPYLMVETPVRRGRTYSRFVAELGIRLEFHIRATRRALFPDNQDPSAAPAPFDPFG